MELEALKEKWAEHDRKLDVSIRLNRQFLMAAKLDRARSPLLHFAFWVGMGALVGLIGLAILGRFLFAHWAEPRFALPAVALHIWMIASVATSVRVLTMALAIDYAQPVAVIQRQLESLRMLRIRATQWGLLTGQLVWWIPFLIVALKGLWNVDAYQFLSPAYLAVNVALGLALIPVAIWISKNFERRMSRSPILQRLMRDLAGYHLNAAAARLASVSEFETETPGRP